MKLASGLVVALMVCSASPQASQKVSCTQAMKALSKQNDEANLPQLTQVLMGSAVRRTRVWTKLRRANDIARELDWMQSLLKSTPIPPLAAAMQAMRTCTPASTGLGEIEIQATTAGLEQEGPLGEKQYEHSMVKIGNALVGTLDKNGKITLLLEPGEYEAWLGLRGGSIGMATTFTADPAHPKHVKVGLDTAKEVYQNADPIVTGANDGMIMNTATSLTFEFRNPLTNAKLNLRSIYAIFIFTRSATLAEYIEKYFTIEQSRVVTTQTGKLREMINAQNEAVALELTAEDSDGRVWEVSLPIRAEAPSQ